jgi:hypothetical protein
MRQLAPDLWIAESPLRFFGVELGARMTVMRLDGSRLLVHSPIPARAELVREVRGLGSVELLVAPNLYHHLSVGDWHEAFPEASLYVAPGLQKKRPELRVAGVLGDEPEPAWASQVDQVLLRGIPATNEVVFFHRPSGTLVASDLAFNIDRGSPPATRVAFRLAGAFGRLRPTFLERLLVRDRREFRRSLQRILEWPIQRVVVAHGAVAEENAKEELARGYSWLLGDGSSS